ncbi:citrate synthase [Rhizobium halophytocola]|uniref:citrate synthase (unknown stereospecificity) n=1 Tax=Rhizobium halophytocola TaxID=735519 RepID=A0ABS4DWD8_9HYPH|nr:citrate synthase [Rhizobium halophytocola]MBP1850005.1 citrate synthase [Rhizobium halophytocola]
MSWLTAGDALARLGTKPQTLYANVSRGRIKAKPDPADPRRSLYHAADVERMAKRRQGRRKSETLAAETIHWGDPILPSAVSTVVDGRLYYRGRDAVGLAARATLEEIAVIQWDHTELNVGTPAVGTAPTNPSLAAAFVMLASRVPNDLPTMGRSRRALVGDAGSVFSDLRATLAPGFPALAAHEALARAFGRPDAAESIRCALVLMADHELNASTFAARVATSSGASLSAAVLAGLSTLTGPLHGSAWLAVANLAEAAKADGVETALRRALARDQTLPAFGHALYPNGDIRAEALLAGLDLPPVLAEIRRRGEEITGEKVNIDFALTALAATYSLPPDAPIILFALARSVGWLAHALEQADGGALIRPRARYVGPAVEGAG